MTNRSHLQPKQTVRSDGVTTTVYVNPDKGNKDERIAAASNTAPSAVQSQDQGSELAAKIADEIRNGSQTFSLTYVDYRDSFDGNDKIVQAFLTGDLDAISEEIDGWDDYENRLESVKHYAGDILREYDLEWDDLDPDEQDEIRFAMEEKDDSNAFDQLIKNTSNKVVRYDLESVQDALYNYCADDEGNVDQDKLDHLTWGINNNFDDRVAFVKSYLGNLGFDTESEEFDKQARSLVGNGNYDWHEGVQMGYTFRADITDVNVNEWNSEENRMMTERDIAFKDEAWFGMIDRYNGSGWVENFPVSEKGVTFTASLEKPVQLDSKAGGYGWEEITGGTYGMDPRIDSTWK